MFCSHAGTLTGRSGPRKAPPTAHLSIDKNPQELADRPFGNEFWAFLSSLDYLNRLFHSKGP